MLESPQDLTGVNSYGHNFAHSIARTADAQTLTLLALALPNLVIHSADFSAEDDRVFTTLMYIEERLQHSEEASELRTAFKSFVEHLKLVARDVEKRGSGNLTLLDEKSGPDVHAVEILDDADRDVVDLFYDAIDSH